MGIDILIISCEDWGCEYTDADREAYETAVAETLECTYPGATIRVETRGTNRTRVIVTTRDKDGKIDASLETARVEAEIEEEARRVAQDVFDQGEFWS